MFNIILTFLSTRPGTCSEPMGIGWNYTLPDSAFNASSSLFSGWWIKSSIRGLKQRRRRRQQERQKTIVLISKTLALHVRYTLWYISLSSSAKQQREMAKFKVLWRT